MEEDDPTKCNALESSLWELKTMQQHYHYFLAKKANQISRTMHQEETPLGDLLEMQTADVSNFLASTHKILFHMWKVRPCGRRGGGAEKYSHQMDWRWPCDASAALHCQPEPCPFNTNGVQNTNRLGAFQRIVFLHCIQLVLFRFFKRKSKVR